MPIRRAHAALARTTRQSRAGDGSPERGQILVIMAIAMVTLVGGVALVLEGGNAYAHQRAAQNAADAAANAGATVIAQRLGGTFRTDADVAAAVNSVAASNGLTTRTAYYTDVYGTMLTRSGNTTNTTVTAAQVGPADGDTSIPPNTQGVAVGGSRTFETTFARVLGMTQFTASADATAVAGALTGGVMMPVVFPVNIVDCATNGDLGTGEANWTISNPDDGDDDPYPEGQEYIVPLCKTDAGSFMILDLDGTMNNCDEEVANAMSVQFANFPVNVYSDNGNNCAKELVTEVNKLAGQVVLIPICDGDCVTAEGEHSEYHVIRVTAFYLDYLSDQNGGTNSACVGDGVNLVAIAGNGSSSCMAGWFVRYITSGPVGPGPILGAGAIGVQLRK